MSDYNDRLDYEPLGQLGSANCIHCGQPSLRLDNGWCPNCSKNQSEAPRPPMTARRAAELAQRYEELIRWARESGRPMDLFPDAEKWAQHFRRLAVELESKGDAA